MDTTLLTYLPITCIQHYRLVRRVLVVLDLFQQRHTQYNSIELMLPKVIGTYESGTCLKGNSELVIKRRWLQG